uniref:Uncharacterized protein n=1 Tax=viral metagenome TaxID=1070528 RepID=A0A6H2A063_9ZZZZ
MATAESFTKKKINDITVFEDRIDREYMIRIEKMETMEQLVSILSDYQEFLPDGLQVFRDADKESFEELKFQIKRFFKRVKNKQKLPAEPTEAIMFITPPMLTIPRQLSLTMSFDTKRIVTFGEAFLRFRNQGLILSLQQQQENMYKRIINVKAQVKEMIDTTSEEAPELDS